MGCQRACAPSVVLLHGRVVGALLVGDTDLEETMEHLILNRLDVRARGGDGCAGARPCWGDPARRSGPAEHVRR